MKNERKQDEVVAVRLESDTLDSIEINDRNTERKLTSDTAKKLECHKDRYIYRQAIIAALIHFTHLVLGPISLPLLWIMFGKNLCTNMGFSVHLFYISEIFN